MPPRRFPLPKPKKKDKKEPVTAEEWYDRGIELEESGERWRSGDKIKSGRFFSRALEAYETSLRLSPLEPNFDSAYNAAHMQFVLAEDSNYHENGLTKEQRLALNKRAIEGHLRAMALVDGMEEHKKKKINLQDLLFNMGQSMRAYAELLTEKTNRLRKSDRDEVLRVLGEAVATFQKVWEIQERKFQEQGQFTNGESIKKEDDDDDEDDFLPKSEDDDEHDFLPKSESDRDGSPAEEMNRVSDEEWYVEEPITLESLLDTATATLETLTVRAQIIPQCDYSPAESLAAIRTLSDPLILTKLIPLVSRVPKLASEVLLVRANFYIALAEAGFRTGLIDVAQYEAEIVQNFSETPIPGAPTQSGLNFKDVRTLCGKADVHSQFAAAVVESSGPDEEELKVREQLAWKHYHFASQSLLAAAAVDKYSPQVQLGRGDIELLRSKLTIQQAEKSREILRRNAAVYYRGAKALAEKDPEIRLEATLKEAMLAWEDGDESLLQGLGAPASKVRVLAAEAVSEGFFGQEWLQRLGISEV